MNRKKILTGILLALLLSVTFTAVVRLLFIILQKVAGGFAAIIPIDPDGAFLPLFFMKLSIIAFCTILFLIQKRAAPCAVKESLDTQQAVFDKKQWRKWLILVVYALVMVAVEVCGALLAHKNGEAIAVPRQPGWFAGFLLTISVVNPIAEEWFFRAVVTTVVILILKRYFDHKRVLFIAAWMVTTIIFTLAHIEWTFIPFQVTHFNLPQLLSVFMQGSVYYWLYVRYRSVWIPILAHGVADAIYCFAVLIFV